jgi:hypothetical protein
VIDEKQVFFVCSTAAFACGGFTARGNLAPDNSR